LEAGKIKRLNKIILILMPCLSLFFVTGRSQGGVAALNWEGTVTGNAIAGSVHKSDTKTYSVDVMATYTNPPPNFAAASANAQASISDGQTASLNVYLDSWGYHAVGNASFSIAGDFTIGSSPEFPMGTPLDLIISGNISSSNFSNKLYRDDNLIWSRISFAGSFTDSCLVFAGENLVLNSSGSAVGVTSGQQIALEVVIPEPASALLLIMGAALLRRKK
jgi:hypothetical protein